jgi:hypothetical protein
MYVVPLGSGTNRSFINICLTLHVLIFCDYIHRQTGYTSLPNDSANVNQSKKKMVSDICGHLDLFVYIVFDRMLYLHGNVYMSFI